MNSMTHYSLVHNFIPVPQALKIPDANAAVKKEWEKRETIPAWQLTKVRNKNEVITEARSRGRTVHFASLMDFCHLKNSELEPQLQKYKGRVVLRGDIVKYGISNDSRKSHGHYIEASRMRRTSSRRSVSLHPGQNGRCTITVKNSEVRVSRYLDTSTETQMAQIMVQYGRSSRSS